MPRNNNSRAFGLSLIVLLFAILLLTSPSSASAEETPTLDLQILVVDWQMESVDHTTINLYALAIGDSCDSCHRSLGVVPPLLELHPATINELESGDAALDYQHIGYAEQAHFEMMATTWETLGTTNWIDEIATNNSHPSLDGWTLDEATPVTSTRGFVHLESPMDMESDATWHLGDVRMLQNPSFDTSSLSLLTNGYLGDEALKRLYTDTILTRIWQRDLAASVRQLALDHPIDNR